MNHETKPRTVVVTGGGRGIGLSIAETFAKSGHRVVVSSRTRSEIDQVAAALRKNGAEAMAIPCDVQDPDQVQALAASVRSEFGPTDILVNNAGIGHSAPLAKTTLEDWNRIIAVNATGTLLCMQAFLPEMSVQDWGRIVNVASVSGLAGGKYIAAYSAAKHAVLGLTRSAAAEVIGTGVTINAVCPGYVDTPMTTKTIASVQSRTGMNEAEALAAVLNTSRQPRLIQPDEVAAAVHYLCQDEGAGVHGQSIVVDGGGLPC